MQVNQELVLSFNILGDIKGAIRINKLKKTDNTIDKGKRTNRTNNDLKNTTQKSKHRATRTPLKTGNIIRCSGRVSSSCLTNDNHRVSKFTQVNKIWIVFSKCPILLILYKIEYTSYHGNIIHKIY